MCIILQLKSPYCISHMHIGLFLHFVLNVWDQFSCRIARLTCLMFFFLGTLLFPVAFFTLYIGEPLFCSKDYKLVKLWTWCSQRIWWGQQWAAWWKCSCLTRSVSVDRRKKKNATVRSVTKMRRFYTTGSRNLFSQPFEEDGEAEGDRAVHDVFCNMTPIYYDKLPLHQTACYSLRVLLSCKASSPLTEPGIVHTHTP